MCASALPVNEGQLNQLLASLPVPSTPFEHLAVRCFMCEALMAVVSRELSDPLPRTLRQFVDLISRNDERLDTLSRFTQLFKDVCLPQERHKDELLAHDISAWLQREYASRVTPDRIAQEYQISRTQIERIFYQRFGVPLHQYLTGIRVRQGLELVMSGMKIEAAAASVGYKSKKDFYRAVRLQTGLTPGEWRRRHSRGS